MAIYTKGFLLHYSGDHAVGIFDHNWQITGGFEFESQHELNEFKQKLKETWELCSDTPLGISTIEEAQEAIRKEKEMYKNLNDECHE